MRINSDNLQVKLSFDEGLKNAWSYLIREYEGLDKASIIRLALNTLVKTTRKQQTVPSDQVLDVIADLKRKEKGMNEKDFFVWWNENKSKL